MAMLFMIFFFDSAPFVVACRHKLAIPAGVGAVRYRQKSGAAGPKGDDNDDGPSHTA